MTTDEFLATELMGIPAEVYQILVNQHEVKWHPTLDITHALGDGGEGTVVGEMRKRRYAFRLELASGGCAAVFFPPSVKTIMLPSMVEADTPAAAISEAARKAIEAEKVRIG